MGDKLFRKGLAIGIIILFIGSNVVSGFNIQLKNTTIPFITGRGNTLYVGGSGPGNYSKINDAYNDANPGDTIFVYSGTYYEFLWLKKTINLIGEDKNTTSIIYNSKHTAPIIIDSPDIVISGLTLYNPNPNLVRYIEINPEDNNIFISNCIFYNNPLHFDDGSVGIDIYSAYNTISNCTFLYNDDEGICLNHGSNHNIVENCIFSNCCMGIEFQNSTFNIINNCIMKDGLYGIGISDKEPLTSDNNFITNCEIFNNDVFGIYLNNGCNNVIYNCSLENNGGCGIAVRGMYSYNNIITNNFINNFNNGILLEFSCHDNTFTNNNIINCETGVCIENNLNQSSCNDNLFYHNNFIDNTKDAYDECSNIWDNGYPSGGNYWDDYTGVDNNGDGIGDTPYYVTSGDNKDNYPLMEPWVKDEITVGANGPYYGLINVPLQFYGLAVGGYKPYSWSWNFGDSKTSDEQNPTHTYTEAGRYDMVLIVTDSHGNSSSDTTFSWIQVTNDPPHTPSITGKTNGKIRTEYNYMFETNDPDENPVWYMVEWGDGTTSGWVGLYSSGQQVTLSHYWTKQGIYTIKAKAKDVYGAESDWTSFEVTISKSKALNYNSLFLKLLERFPLLQKLIDILERYE